MRLLTNDKVPRLVLADPKGINHVLNGQKFIRNESDVVALEIFVCRLQIHLYLFTDSVISLVVDCSALKVCPVISFVPSFLNGIRGRA